MVFITISFIGFISLVVMVLDDVPLISQKHQISASHADHSKRLASRIIHTLRQKNQNTQLVLTQSEINGLAALFHRAQPSSALNITLSEHGAVFMGAIKLPKPLDTKFINITTTLLPSSSGVELAQVNLGCLSLSGKSVVSVISFALDYYAGQGTTKKLLETVTQVSMSPNQLVVGVNVNDDVLALRQDASLLSKLRDELALFGDKKLIEDYYQRLVTFAQSQPIDSPLHPFINHIFSYVVSKNLQISPDSYIEQNNALLVALVLYFGHDRMALLVGELAYLPWRQRVRRSKHRGNVTLAGRGDLQQHFIYSIALQLLSNAQASDALGEFKEFLDTNQGGSGFSFADLMADRAGTRLAMMTTYSEEQAAELQLSLAKVTDSELLPSIDGLAEGIDEQRFKREYQGVHSKSYQQMVSSIDNRLKSLSLYQYHWR